MLGQGRVATLTCIGTPHLGSPVASLVNVFNPFHLLSVTPIRGIEHFEDVRAELNAVDDLAVDGARAINETCRDLTDGTRYFEIAGIGRPNGTSSAFFAIPFSLLTLAGVQNDGVVPFESATRGRTPLEIWAGDHADLVGHDLDRPPLFQSASFDHLPRYESVVRKAAI